jgi:hypothetical protein
MDVLRTNCGLCADYEGMDGAPRPLPGVSLCPWRIGATTAAALVLLHHVHGRTT